jgi:hypothetical protein
MEQMQRRLLKIAGWKMQDGDYIGLKLDSNGITYTAMRLNLQQAWDAYNERFLAVRYA